MWFTTHRDDPLLHAHDTALQLYNYFLRALVMLMATLASLSSWLVLSSVLLGAHSWRIVMCLLAVNFFNLNLGRVSFIHV